MQVMLTELVELRISSTLSLFPTLPSAPPLSPCSSVPAFLCTCTRLSSPRISAPRISAPLHLPTVHCTSSASLPSQPCPPNRALPTVPSQCSGLEVSSREIEAWAKHQFETADTDKSGSIDFEEFASVSGIRLTCMFALTLTHRQRNVQAPQALSEGSARSTC